jgi:hypothetical protein
MINMKTICSAFAGASFDGFIARADGTLDIQEGDGTAPLGENGKAIRLKLAASGTFPGGLVRSGYAR